MSHKTLLPLCAALLLPAVTLAAPDYFVTQKGQATFKQSLALQSYVQSISRYQPETIALTRRLQKTIAYYQRVHILKTVSKKEYTIDCIPFAEQPALIDNPELAHSLLPTMMQTTATHLDELKQLGSHFDFNAATECPIGSVAILRPNNTMLTSTLANEKTAPGKIRPQRPLTASGYSWEQGFTPRGATIYINGTANQAYFKGPQNQYVNPRHSGDHSLNQFWFTDTGHQPHESLTYSVEFGIIASAYFTTTPSTSIFVFASVDNYGTLSCYNLECPNFVQAPGTTPLGVPIRNKNVDYLFQVTHATGSGLQPGYYLTLISHATTADTEASGGMLLGYYPEGIYPAGNLPHQFSAGAEVYASAPNNGTIMWGNYANPYAGYSGEKVIGLTTENNNNFTFTSSVLPAPYGLVWNFGQ